MRKALNIAFGLTAGCVIGFGSGTLYASYSHAQELKADPDMRACREKIGQALRASKSSDELSLRYSRISCAEDYRRIMHGYGNLVIILTLTGGVAGGIIAHKKNTPKP